MAVTATFNWYNPNTSNPKTITIPDGGSLTVDNDHNTSDQNSDVGSISFEGSGTITIVGNGHKFTGNEGITIGNDVYIILDNYSVTMNNDISGGNIYLKNGSEVTINGTAHNGGDNGPGTYPASFHFVNSPGNPGGVLNVINNGGAIYDSNIQIYNLTPGDNLIIGDATTDTIEWKKEADGSYSVFKAGAGAIGYPEYDKLLGGIHLADNITPDMFTYDRSKGEIVCYLKGTMVKTDRGYVPVERLRKGTKVYCVTTGKYEKVIWVGKAFANIDDERPYADFAGYPVVIKKDAFGIGHPSSDLSVTNEHSIYLNGCFIPVRMLVNGKTIYYNRDMKHYWYYHFELEFHSVVDVNGIFSESYLNTGNRSIFPQEAPEGDTIKNWNDHAAAPLLTGAGHVKQIYDRIDNWAQNVEFVEKHKHARKLKNVLFLEKDGKKVFPFKKVEDKFMFMLPNGFDECDLVVSTARPCDIDGPWMDDRREIEIVPKAISRMDNLAIRADTNFKFDKGFVRRKINTVGKASVLSVNFH